MPVAWDCLFIHFDFVTKSERPMSGEAGHLFSRTLSSFCSLLLPVQPSAGFYNLFNFANFDLPGNALNGLLTGAPAESMESLSPGTT
jgi:hypothetical protein